MFQIATRQQSRLRMTIDGPAGSGKSYTALRFAHALGGRIAAIDTERGSLSKYVGEAPDGIPWKFDVVNLFQFSPEKYTELIQIAGKMAYNVLIIDSLSHAWEGAGGALEIKDKVGGNDWKGWRTVTPIHNRMVDAILQSPCHVITTMRSRMEHVQETDSSGKVVVRKVGMAPIQRPGMEYEFDLVCDMDWAHILTVSKSRCSAVADMKIDHPGPNFLSPVIEWLGSGSPGISNNGHEEVQKPITPTITLEALLDQFGEETILAANNNIFPASNEEITAIAQLLGITA